VYAWIWRLLPFGRPGRLAGSALLVLAAAALLWYLVFPAVDPHLPFTTSGEVTRDAPGGPTSPGPSGTGSVAPSPSPSATGLPR
jgi:hypothetical protein